jgi:hypothetical protein
MQTLVAVVLLLASFGIGIWAGFWVNKRLLGVPYFIRLFVGIMVFVVVSWPLGFVVRLAVYGHL